jgi:outer membrane lipoprotein LolB
MAADKRLLLSLAVCLVIASCSTAPVVTVDSEASSASFQKRQLTIGSMETWTLSGKLSIDDSQEGGSGRLTWSVSPGRSQMNFRGALGKGAWQLQSEPGKAELRKADGSLSSAASVNELAESELGWRVPVDALRWWALGLPAAGEPDVLDLDAEGRVLSMQQRGWHIRYDRYKMFGAFELPARMDAVHGRYRVKMAISSWTVPEAAPTDE